MTACLTETGDVVLLTSYSSRILLSPLPDFIINKGAGFKTPRTIFSKYEQDPNTSDKNTHHGIIGLSRVKDTSGRSAATGECSIGLATGSAPC